MDCEFLDTSEFIKSSDLDGIRFEQEEHFKLGEAVAQRCPQLFNDSTTLHQFIGCDGCVNVNFARALGKRNWIGEYLVRSWDDVFLGLLL
jgi:hypothetical protein